MTNPIIGRLDKFKPIGWYSRLGSGLAKGHYWAQCPDCEEECVFDPQDKPTSIHRGVK